MYAPPLERLVGETLALLKPPPRLPLSGWAEEYFRLPERSSAQPGRFRLWKYQRAWLDVIGDKTTQRVTLEKSARIGFTKCLMAAIGGYAANAPCSVILLVPTLDDTRRYAVDEIEPSFAETPSLRGLISRGRNDGRNTLTMKAFLGGGSLKILAARSPRNLRAHDAKVLFIDEADGMEVTVEGDPIALAEKRTLAHADRKIVVGSTPTIEGISVVDKLYKESDQRIFEVPCPHCGGFFEILWQHIRWPEGRPDEACCHCPHCDTPIEERCKPAMIAAGDWRVTRPEVVGHAGFRINALVSLFSNARWPVLAAEYLKAKRAGPADLQVFANTVEGRVWKQSIDSIDEAALRARADVFSLDRMPTEVLALTAGVDTQNDRLEVSIWGWSETTPFALGHFQIWGSTLEEATWDRLDALLRRSWPHPNGSPLAIDAVAIDSGGTGQGAESRTQQVYDFCAPRAGRRIYPIKGMTGPRVPWQRSKSKTLRVKLALVGVDPLKTEIMERLAALPFLDAKGEPVAVDVEGGLGRNPAAIRVNANLPPEWFEQMTSERRFIAYVRNRPRIEFRPTKAGIRNEALDCAVYAFAVRHAVRIDFAERASRRAEARPAPKRSLADFSKLNGGT
jgi:phage terminase large subunit GpA-like protein